METVHATCVAILGRGVLLLGESGSGKSSLALRLIDRGAMLVGDDRICLHADDGLEQRTLNPHQTGGMLSADFKSKVALETYRSKASLPLECDNPLDPAQRSHSRRDALVAYAPGVLAGLIEVRGLGIFSLPFRRKAPLALAVVLAGSERLPVTEHWRWGNQMLPLVHVAANATDAAQKVERALSAYGLSVNSPA